MSCNDESSTNTSNSRDNSQPISPSPTKRNQTNAINLGDGESSRNCSHDDNKPPKKKTRKTKTKHTTGQKYEKYDKKHEHIAIDYFLGLHEVVWEKRSDGTEQKIISIGKTPFEDINRITLLHTLQLIQVPLANKDKVIKVLRECRIIETN